jgi:hypothetical protein
MLRVGERNKIPKGLDFLNSSFALIVILVLDAVGEAAIAFGVMVRPVRTIRQLTEGVGPRQKKRQPRSNAR